MKTPDELTELFRANGRKVTAQRQCIFRVLQGDVTHPSAEAVHAAASREMETISLKTVYQTLHDLAELGEIASLDVGTGHDPVRSQRRRRPPPPGLPPVRQGARPGAPTSPTCRFPMGADLGFEVGSAEIVFRGLCPECQAGTDAAPAGAGHRSRTQTRHVSPLAQYQQPVGASHQP